MFQGWIGGLEIKGEVKASVHKVLAACSAVTECQSLHVK